MEYQDKNYKYIDAEAYDKRGKNSILENYILGLWQPFLKNKVQELSIGKIVADLGCGTGEYTQVADNSKKIYAIDISEPMLKICRRKLSNLKQAEIIEDSVLAVNLPLLDLVITIGIWEYVNPNSLYEKIKNITQPGSKIIAVFPNIYNKLNLTRSIVKIKKVALRPGFIKKLFRHDFRLLESASFGTVSWCPEKLQFLILPIWKFGDLIWGPFQKFMPLGINVYYLFERK